MVLGPGAASKAWEVLRDFESQERVKQAYLLAHGRRPRTEHAREITAPLTHGRSYFESARNADPSIRPLLLYYGVLNISRGLILMLSRGLRESALRPGHGLSCDKWTVEMQAQNPRFEELRLTAGKSGTFVELSAATVRCTALRANSSMVNMMSRERGHVAGHTYTMGDILARVPQLERSNVAWRNVSLCSPWSTASKSPGRATLRIPRKHRKFVNRDYCDALFKNTSFQFASEEKEQFLYEGPDDFSQVPGVTDRADALGIGQLWLVARYPGDVWLSRIESLFSISYALGMIVRYFPKQWTSLLKGQVSDESLPTLFEAIELIASMYPIAASDLLTGYPLLAQVRNSESGLVQIKAD